MAGMRFGYDRNRRPGDPASCFPGLDEARVQLIDAKAKRSSVVGASPIQLRRQLCGLVTDPNIERVGRYGGWKTNWSNPNRCGEARSMSNPILALCFNGQRGVRPCHPAKSKCLAVESAKSLISFDFLLRRWHIYFSKNEVKVSIPDG
jgi:hypothetical protein